MNTQTQTAEAVGSSGEVGRPVLERADVSMKPMELEGGRLGWYIDHPDFYCDLEPDAAGVWSVYFRDRHTGNEAFAERMTPNPEVSGREPGERSA